MGRKEACSLLPVLKSRIPKIRIQPSLEDVFFPGAGSLFPLAVLLSVVTQWFRNPPDSSCN